MFIGKHIDDVFKGVEHFFLKRFTFKNAASQGVNRLTLRVHDIVVLNEVFTDIEVSAFDAFLSRFDRTRDDTGFDGDIGIHTKSGHAILEFFTAKDTNEIVI